MRVTRQNQYTECQSCSPDEAQRNPGWVVFTMFPDSTLFHPGYHSVAGDMYEQVCVGYYIIVFLWRRYGL